MKGNNREEYDIAVLNLETGAYAVVVEGGTYPRYASTGHLVYGGGSPVVGSAVRSRPACRDRRDDRSVALVDPSGRADPLNLPPDRYLSPRVSPDGERLAVQTIGEDGGVIWTYDLSDDRQIRQLTFEGDNQRPVWTPDGTRITFASDRDGATSLYSQPADGSAAAQRLTSAAANERHWPGSWSPDGAVLAFNVVSASRTPAIWTLSRVDGGRDSAPLLEEDGRVYGFPEFSPDGRWLAYSAGDSALALDVYVEPFPPTGRIERITREGGYYPFWSKSGDRLFYRNANSPFGVRLRAVDIETTPEFRFTNETLLAPEGFIVETGYRDFDVVADGSELLMVFPIEQDDAPLPEVAVVLNWTQELLERVPLP